MAEPTLFDRVKLALRQDGDYLDGEIQDLIDASLADLGLSGVDAEDVTDPLIKRAVIIYCRAHFDFADESSENLLKSYLSLKSHLSLSEDYKAVAE